MRHVACLVILAASTLTTQAETISVLGYGSLPDDVDSVTPFSVTDNGLTATFTSDVDFRSHGGSLFNNTLEGTLNVAFSHSISELTLSTDTFSQGETVNFDIFQNGVLQSSRSVVVGDPKYSGGPAPVFVDLTGTFNSINIESRDFFEISPLTATTAVTATPEPSTFALLGTGLLGAASVVRRRIMAV